MKQQFCRHRFTGQREIDGVGRESYAGDHVGPVGAHFGARGARFGPPGGHLELILELPGSIRRSFLSSRRPSGDLRGPRPLSGRLWGWIMLDLGTIWGAFGGAFWHPNRSKIEVEKHSENGCQIFASWKRCGTISGFVGGHLGVKNVDFSLVFKGFRENHCF